MQSKPILVVEDDPVIAGVICRGLSDLGHETLHVDCGDLALRRCQQGDVGAMVLDRMLPDISGIDVLERLRQTGFLPPVLMLSALGSVRDRIEGLTAGADDYLTKPFDTAELGARLAAICRRGARVQPVHDDLTVGRLRLDNAAHSAFLGEARIELNRKQFSMLAYLMRHADRVVTRAMLLENVWGYAFDPATNIVESNMSRLRSRLLALGCDAVETLRGEGYLLRSTRCA
jgi:two-component system OmpR family response regulator